MSSDQLKWGKLQPDQFLSKVMKRFDRKLQNQFPVDHQPLKGYASGSIYSGEWSPVDLDGVGTFILPHGVVYEGHLKDGVFHGKGVLIYPMGQMVVGEWCEGEITSWKFKYKNIEQCALDTYCKPPDRRFLTTLYHELKPAGKELLTNNQPTIDIPEGCYDVVDGFYNPKTLWVHSSKNFSKVLYMPAPRRIPIDMNILKDDGNHFIKKVPFVPIYRTSQWIEGNCRKAWDEATKFKPQLFEYWYTGRKFHEKFLDMRLEKRGGKFVWNESVCDEMLRNFELLADKQRSLREEKQAFEDFKITSTQAIETNHSNHESSITSHQEQGEENESQENKAITNDNLNHFQK